MTYARRARTIQPLLTLAGGASATLVLLVANRPTAGGVGLPKGLGSWTVDDLAAAGLWLGAVVGSAWLAVTTLSCVAAVARGRTRSAHRIARFAPPVARRVLQAALVSTWALVPTAAYAAPPSAPITVHVDANGRLTGDTPRAETDPPVVRTPATRHATTTTIPTTSVPATIRPTTTTIAPTSRPTSATAPSVSPSTNPPPAVNRPAPPRVAMASPTPVSLPTRARVHVVVPGDNLWKIARVEVTRVSGSDRVDDAHVAGYWQRVIAANRSTLRSGDPSLIFPGEVVTLP
jgi:hypothetical protein